MSIGKRMPNVCTEPVFVNKSPSSLANDDLGKSPRSRVKKLLAMVMFEAIISFFVSFIIYMASTFFLR